MEVRLITRILIGIVTIVVVMILIFLAERAGGEESIYQGVPLDEHLLRLDKEALEEAYKAHVQLLFSVWLKDDIKVVHRINTGLANGRRAYFMAREKLEERERQMRR